VIFINSNNIISATTEVIKVVPQIYNDGLKPSVQEVGKVLVTVTGTLNTLLSPLKLLNATVSYREEEFIKKLHDKTKNIPPERLIEPSLSIVGPALEDLKYSLDEEDIRNLYVNLLSSSMDLATSKNVHRCFIEIIKQLSPVESRFLKFIYPEILNRIPTGKIRIQMFDGGWLTVLEHFITTSFEDCSPEQMCVYFTNLERLGIISITYATAFIDKKKYILFDDYATFKKYHTRFINQPECIDVKYKKGILALTPLGKSFCAICMAE
jgi:hypothetical protein